MTDQPIEYGTRKHFEDVLQQAMRSLARKPLDKDKGERVAPEIYPTFRMGFKCALMAFDLIKGSTTELNDKQLKILTDRLELLIGIKPPPPPHP